MELIHQDDQIITQALCAIAVNGKPVSVEADQAEYLGAFPENDSLTILEIERM